MKMNAEHATDWGADTHRSVVPTSRSLGHSISDVRIVVEVLLENQFILCSSIDWIMFCYILLCESHKRHPQLEGGRGQGSSYIRSDGSKSGGWMMHRICPRFWRFGCFRCHHPDLQTNYLMYELILGTKRRKKQQTPKRLDNQRMTQISSSQE